MNKWKKCTFYDILLLENKGRIQMFENIEDAKKEIRTRTSKIIGGYITENMFINKYTTIYPNRAYSKGWWGGIERNEEKRLTFFVVKNELSELDCKVIACLQKHNYSWKQLVCRNDVWYVRDYSSVMPIEQYINMRNLISSHNLDVNYPQTVGDAVLEKCIKEYEEQGILKEIASSIYIEDHFLNAYYTISNIDLIGESEDGIPIYIEIKFKNEFSKEYDDGKKLVFGIDEFQYDNLFSAFLNSEMLVENIILYNDVKNSHNVNTTVIFDFLNRKGNQPLIWKSKEIRINEHYEKHTFSTGKTSWKGAGERTVYCIPIKQYRDVGENILPNGVKQYYPAGGWGICNICGSNKVVRRNKSNGNEFIGCLEYKNH